MRALMLVMRLAVYLGLFSGGIPSILVLAGILAVTLTLSATIFVGYERPMRSRVRRRLMPTVS